MASRPPRTLLAQFASNPVIEAKAELEREEQKKRLLAYLDGLEQGWRLILEDFLSRVADRVRRSEAIAPQERHEFDVYTVCDILFREIAKTHKAVRTGKWISEYPLGELQLLKKVRHWDRLLISSLEHEMDRGLRQSSGGREGGKSKKGKTREHRKAAEVREFVDKSKLPFPRAIECAAKRFNVHPRTIRRDLKKR